MRWIWLSVVFGFACGVDKSPIGEEEEDFSAFIQDADGDGFTQTEDCNDSDSVIFPGAEEICDGVDNDCDGSIDEDVTTTYYQDIDGDGFGDVNTTQASCQVSDGWVFNGTDCDDTESSVYPGASERCDGVDNDCDGEIDEGVVEIWYSDLDGDGFGDPDAPSEGCDPPSGYVVDDTDCNDQSPSVYPGASEICDALDNDCDGVVDEGVTSTFYADSDGDGYGDPAVAVEDCEASSAYVDNDDDCDDTSDGVHPAATELCNGIDDDCDDDLDDLDDDIADATLWYIDYDGDGYGSDLLSETACAQPPNYVENADDCDDTEPSTYPGAEELCNDLDDDCDGDIDEGTSGPTTWYEDADEDGYGDPDGMTSEACESPSGYADNDEDCDDEDADINPAVSEECNGYDDDCDGEADSSSVCPCDVEYYDGDTDHPYMFCLDSLDWSDARASCDDYGYHLLTIDDSSENVWVDDTADNLSTSQWWIGLNDRVTEGTFEWEDATPLIYTAWHSGEPNDYGSGEDCTQINFFHPSQTWNDKTCTDTNYFICEVW